MTATRTTRKASMTPILQKELTAAYTAPIMGLQKVVDPLPDEIRDAYRSHVEDAGGLVPEGASDNLLRLAATVAVSANTIARADRTIALALARIEASEEYKSLKDSQGYTFSSAASLFGFLFPWLAKSTIYNYLSVARTLYLPAETGDLEPALIPLAQLPPATAQFAVGAIKDSELEPYLESELQKHYGVHGKEAKLTQGALKGIVQRAKDAYKAQSAKPAADTDTDTAAVTDTAAADTDAAAPADTADNAVVKDIGGKVSLVKPSAKAAVNAAVGVGDESTADKVKRMVRTYSKDRKVSPDSITYGKDAVKAIAYLLTRVDIPREYADLADLIMSDMTYVINGNPDSIK